MQTLGAHRGCVTVGLAGELDHYTALDIRAQLDAILRDPTIRHMVLDLGQMTFMDSSGIGVLLGRLRVLQARGGTLSVARMQPQVEKLFYLSGLQRVIGITEIGREVSAR